MPDDDERDERDWRDEYLDEQLDEDDHDGPDEVAPAPPMSRFRHGSIGLTLGAAMTGLGNVLEPSKKEDPPVVIEHDEPDQSNERLEMHLDRDDPTASVVIIRKWIPEHPDPKDPEQ